MNGKVSGFHVTTTCQNLMCTHRQTHTRGYSVPHTWMTGCAVSVGRISPKLDSYNDLRLQLSARTHSLQLLATDGLRPKLQELSHCSYNT